MVMEITVKGGGGEEYMGDGMLQCSEHPYRNSNNKNPGGICAFCLQEKLGKLVSSSFPLPIRPSTTSSSPANGGGGGGGGAASLSLSVTKSMNENGSKDSHFYDNQYYTRRPRTKIPFLLAKKAAAAAASDRTTTGDTVLKRSKSTTNPRRGGGHLFDAEDNSPRKRISGFWSFLHLSSKPNTTKKIYRNSKTPPPPPNFVPKPKEEEREEEEEDESPTDSAASSFERKVSRSRSVGCGSRSFSGDFFERISTGFGDCTLRRVESQREGKHQQQQQAKVIMQNNVNRVKCGGIFGGFIMNSSSSSSSSSSNYWVSANSGDQGHINGSGKSSRSWGWAFASPRRAVSKNSKDEMNKNGGGRSIPNMDAIPSLLAVRS